MYWSHFQAALDWPDAEMWLEGAVQNGWSISQMRDSRGEAVGAAAELKPREEDVIQAEFDEDAGDGATSAMPESIHAALGTVRETSDKADDGTNADFDTVHAAADLAAETMDEIANEPAAAPFRPFENLAPLPPDLNEAFELFKLGILSHKVSGWQEVSRETVLAASKALKQLALAPAG